MIRYDELFATYDSSEEEAVGIKPGRHATLRIRDCDLKSMLGLPQNMQIKSAEYDWSTRSVEFIIEHEAFPVLREGMCKTIVRPHIISELVDGIAHVKWQWKLPKEGSRRPYSKIMEIEYNPRDMPEREEEDVPQPGSADRVEVGESVE